MAKNKYYAVKVGLTPGIYTTWAECEANVKGYPKAEYKGFKELSEAEAYMDGAESADTYANVSLNHNTNTSPAGDADNIGDLKDNPSPITYESYIGQDEVGKSEPFRRIIVVSAYLDDNHMDELKTIGATNDSKNYGLDTDKCIMIGKELTDFESFKECENGIYENEKYGITFSIYSISNGYYNELHEKEERINANKIIAIMHNRAGFNLCNHLAKKGIRIKDVVIDNFMGKNDCDKLYAKYASYEKYRLDKSGVNMHFETKSEKKYPAVAVAANIANYIEALYANEVRNSIAAKGGDLDSHGFSNSKDDVQYAFDEIVKVYGSLDSRDIEEEFKHTQYYNNYTNSGHV